MSAPVQSRRATALCREGQARTRQGRHGDAGRTHRAAATSPVEVAHQSRQSLRSARFHHLHSAGRVTCPSASSKAGRRRCWRLS